MESKRPIELDSRFGKPEDKESQKSWSEKLIKWLPHGTEQEKAEAYADLLIESQIDNVAILAQLEGSDLAEMKIPAGHRAHILEGARAETAKIRNPVSYYSVCGKLGLKLNGMWAEFTHIELWQGVVAEFLACGIYVFILNSIIVSSGTLLQTPNGWSAPIIVTDLPADRYLSIAIGAGFAWALACYTFVPSNAGHVSPAITFGLMLTSTITPLRWALYLAAQLCGAMVATGFVKTVSMVNFASAEGGCNIIDNGYTPGTSTGIETLTTFILVLTALSYWDNKRHRHGSPFGPLAIGFVVLVVHLISLPINGTSMNPARSFASSAVFGYWDAQWTYWLGPALGAGIAIFTYEIFVRDKSCQHESQTHCHSQ